MLITNNNNIDLTLAVWLLHDEYDYIDKPNYISATTLMKPLRQIVLPMRVPPEQRTMDISDLIASSMGTALHDSIEKAWTANPWRALKLLGYPESVIQRVRINPTPEELQKEPDCIPVYLEQRAFKDVTINGVTYTIGGKFDLVLEGVVQDNKSTSVYTWIHGGKDDDYSLQGSIYKWLNPDKILDDIIRINFIFTDWKKMEAARDPSYPQQRVAAKDVPLRTMVETDTWIRNKLSLVQQHMNTPENQLPECTDEELWRSDPKYKYYADPAKAGTPGARSTKNFDNLPEAKVFMNQEKGGKGVIITVPGEVKRCGYCNAYEVCTQRLKYDV